MKDFVTYKAIDVTCSKSSAGFLVSQLFKTRIVKKRATFVRKVTIGEVSAKSAGNDSRFGAVTQRSLRKSMVPSGVAYR